MIKWIGQHIWDFTSRFRADVYFDNLSSAKNNQVLLIDENEKLASVNSFLFMPDTDSANGAETSAAGRQSLRIGEDNNLQSYITKISHSDGDGGKLFLQAGSVADGGATNGVGGHIFIMGGAGTGKGVGGDVVLSTKKPGSSNGTSLNTNACLLTWKALSTSAETTAFLEGPIGLSLGIKSSEDMVFRIDHDDDDTGKSFFFQNNATTTIAELNESGDLQIDGDLTVSGGDITLSGTGRIQGIDTVTDSTDAASKAYVDTAISGTVGSAVDLTSEVSGVLPVANGGTGASSLTDNKILTGTGTSAVTAEANATYDGTDFTLLSASQYKPILKLHNQNNSAESPELLFLNQRTSDASGVSANGDEAGKVTFQSINNRGGGSGGPEDITYAQVKGSIFDNTDGGEDGRLALQVTEGGSLTTAFDAYGTGLGTINTFGNGGIFSYSNFDSTLTFFTSSVSTAPNVSISNYTDDATGPTLTLGNLRGGISGGKTDGSDNDSCGTINFNAYDDGTPTATTFAKIEGIAKDVSDGAEEGKLTLSVASHDAEIQPGLTIESGDAEDEVDVTIGNGSASVVTVPGFISIGGHTINDIDVAGEFVDSDEHLMTAAAINDRIAAAGGGVSVSDSTANTDFPVVFHDESNNLHDDTGAFTYNPSTGNAVIPKIQTAGNIELGHASDTTIARSGAGRVTIEGNTIITAGDEVVSAGNHILKQTKVTIDTSGFNGLNSTPVDLVAAQGANTMIVPTEVVVFADRAATNTNSTDLIVAYNGGTSFATAVKYIRRFMQNVTTDRITIMGPYVGTASNDLTTPINSKLTIALGAAPTTNCMTSLTVYTSYYVIDIS